MESGQTGVEEQVEKKVAYENPLMSNEMLRRIHAYMVECRAEASVASGLEAIEVATLVHLKPEDTIAPIGKQWIAAKIGSSPLRRMMVEIFPDMLHQPVPKVVVGNRLATGAVGVATGVAFAYKMQGLGSAVVVFGDRAILGRGNGALMEFAGERKLPILYVVETNLGDEIPPSSIQKVDDETNATAAKCGFPSISVDGHDAVAVYRVVQEAIARARKGGGPTLVDCRTRRGQSRTTRQGGIDPVLHMEQYLSKRGLSLRIVS